MIGASSVFPLDVVKTRMQNSRRLPDGTLPYKGSLDCFKQVENKTFTNMSAIYLMRLFPAKDPATGGRPRILPGSASAPARCNARESHKIGGQRLYARPV